ncbi:Uma2 family endonuclease [Actinoplanes sp. TBRC 11911]|uniref:Uma2 family endonuclease n=1 Tax=Actinoplanes sp. TBRC 11911 TaxID=2729386 RepID=UPI00200710FD|nr:Uma2 family endonuclease [Actinoplanes sp. TBRC 11911]
MTKADFNHPDPWTEAEYLALDETNSRIELIDGGLWVSPAPTNEHQEISYLLTTILRPPASAAKLCVTQAGNVRLGPDRLVSPDITVRRPSKPGTRTEAADVVMVAEITSPSNATADRRFKKLLYAEAGIGWYLLVEPDHGTYQSIFLRLLRLEDTKYVEHAFAEYGETLITDLPFPVEISTEHLLDFAGD